MDLVRAEEHNLMEGHILAEEHTAEVGIQVVAHNLEEGHIQVVEHTIKVDILAVEDIKVNRMVTVALEALLAVVEDILEVDNLMEINQVDIIASLAAFFYFCLILKLNYKIFLSKYI